MPAHLNSTLSLCRGTNRQGTWQIGWGGDAKIPVSVLEKAISACEQNIANCQAAFDIKKVEDMYSEAKRLVGEAQKLAESGNLYKAKEVLESAERAVNEAFITANKRKFEDAQIKLRDELSEIRRMKDTVDERLLGVPKVVKFEGRPKIGEGAAKPKRAVSREELEKKIINILKISKTISIDVIAEALGVSRGEAVAVLAEASGKLGMEIEIVDDKIAIEKEDVGKVIDALIAQFETKKM